MVPAIFSNSLEVLPGQSLQHTCRAAIVCCEPSFFQLGGVDAHLQGDIVQQVLLFRVLLAHDFTQPINVFPQGKDLFLGDLKRFLGGFVLEEYTGRDDHWVNNSIIVRYPDDECIE